MLGQKQGALSPARCSLAEPGGVLESTGDDLEYAGPYNAEPAWARGWPQMSRKPGIDYQEGIGSMGGKTIR